MSASRVGAFLLFVALVSGAVADRVPARTPIVVGGYRVLAVDLHTHSSMWSDGVLTPWGLVLEAQRQQLDAIAVTGHHQLSDAKVARWFSTLIGGPTVIVGEELLAVDHHVLAIGVEAPVHSVTVQARIADIHAQGGVAIAAHPMREFWPAFAGTAAAGLDGAEVCHPLVYGNREAEAALIEFSAARSTAAIGSSDFHGLGRMGECRTYVFAADSSAPAILDAIRAKRTVVYGPNGRVFGNQQLAALISRLTELRDLATTDGPVSTLDWLSRVTGLLGLVLLVASSHWRDRR